MTTKGERVTAIRKAVKLNQTDFGEKIGIGQHAVSHIEKGTNNLSERNFDRICQQFNVNPVWLETGVGDMFKPPPEENFLDVLARQKGLNDEEKALIGSIIDLPREARQAVIDWAFKLVARIEVQAEDNNTAEERELLEIIETAEKTAENAKKRLAEVRRVAPYVEDTSKEIG